MSDRLPPGARVAPAAGRNRLVILEALRPWLPAAGLVLEIAAGTGEHALLFASALPHLAWLPADADPEALVSIAAWRDHAGPPNLLAPVRLDASEPDRWPVGRVEVVVCINMIHIAPPSATEGLLAGAGRILPAGGVLFLYGPFLEAGVATAPSNLAFDADLKRRDPRWGLRDLAVVGAAARRHDLLLERRIAMPAENLSVVFRKA